MNKEKKQFCVRKFVFAESAAHAISIEKKFPVDDVFVVQNQASSPEILPAIGFRNDHE